MKNLFKRHYIVILVSAVILTAIAVTAVITARHEQREVVKPTQSIEKPVKAKDEAKEEAQEAPSTLPGKKEYDQIETEMPVADAKRLLGEPSSETAYESQGRKNSTIMFNAKGDFGAYIMITTSEGKVMSKSQFGLK